MPPSRSILGHASKSIRHGYIRGILVTAVWVALYFLGAGHIGQNHDVWNHGQNLAFNRGWVCILVYVGCTFASGLVLLFFNPAVVEARANFKHADTRAFDRLFMSIFFPLTLLQPLVAGIDAARLRLLPLPPLLPLPISTLAIGIALCVFATAIICSALLANSFAETTVRLQSDRGHTVVTRGPYRIVRHPMYVGLLLLYPSLALMFGSGWALIIAALIDILLVWRTAQEDRFLARELPGYSEYTRRTRFRLIPLLW